MLSIIVRPFRAVQSREACHFFFFECLWISVHRKNRRSWQAKSRFYYYYSKTHKSVSPCLLMSLIRGEKECHVGSFQWQVNMFVTNSNKRLPMCFSSNYVEGRFLLVYTEHPRNVHYSPTCSDKDFQQVHVIPQISGWPSWHQNYFSRNGSQTF